MTNNDFDTMIDDMTAEQFDAFMAICFDNEDIHAELSGDDYVDAVLADM